MSRVQRPLFQLGCVASVLFLLFTIAIGLRSLFQTDCFTFPTPGKHSSATIVAGAMAYAQVAATISAHRRSGVRNAAKEQRAMRRVESGVTVSTVITAESNLCRVQAASNAMISAIDRDNSVRNIGLRPFLSIDTHHDR